MLMGDGGEDVFGDSAGAIEDLDIQAIEDLDIQDIEEKGSGDEDSDGGDADSEEDAHEAEDDGDGEEEGDGDTAEDEQDEDEQNEGGEQEGGESGAKSSSSSSTASSSTSDSDTSSSAGDGSGDEKPPSIPDPAAGQPEVVTIGEDSGSHLLTHSWRPAGLPEDANPIVFTYIPPEHAAARDRWPVWRVKCPFHGTKEQPCTRQRTCGSAGDDARDLCYRRLLAWVLEGGLQATKIDHGKVHQKPIPKSELPTVEELKSQALDSYKSFATGSAAAGSPDEPALKRRRRGKCRE